MRSRRRPRRSMMVADILVCLGRERVLDAAIDAARPLDATLCGMGDSKDRVVFLARCTAAGVASRVLEPTDLAPEMRRHDLTVLGRETEGAHEERPVLVVPEKNLTAGPAILVAYDGSSAARRALRAFGESGLARGRPVHVATVGDDVGAAWDTAIDGCELLLDLGVLASAHNLLAPSTVSRALLEHRAALNAGLMVLGAYTRSHMARFHWGAVTHEMLDKSEVPLFLHY